MNALTILFIFVPVLVAILLVLNVLLAVHRPDSEKVTPYECGFSPVYGQTRAPFSIQYYLVGLLFLVFDLEILLLYPIAVNLYTAGAYGFTIAILFFVILTLGFVYEYGKGALYFTDQRSVITKSPCARINQSDWTPQQRMEYKHYQYSLVYRPSSAPFRSGDVMVFNGRYISTSATSNGVLLHPQRLAQEHIDSGAETTLDILNEFLMLSQTNAKQEFYALSEHQFDLLCDIVPLSVKLPLDLNDPITRRAVGPVIARTHPDYKKNRLCGVYVWTNKVTGEHYVGSSVDLARRVRSYLSPQNLINSDRVVMQSLAKYGVNNFTLMVYVVERTINYFLFSDTNVISLILGLEQYLIFTTDPKLNTLKAVNFPGSSVNSEETKAIISATNSRPIYLYSPDGLTLLGVYRSAVELMNGTGLGQSTVSRYLNSGDTILDSFFLSRDKLPVVSEQQTPLSVIKGIFTSYRSAVGLPEEVGTTKSARLFSSKGQKYILTDTRTGEKLPTFPTGQAVVTFLSDKGGIAASTLSIMKAGATKVHGVWSIEKVPKS